MKRALISVSDKTNLVDFAKGLTENGYEIVSTGGTKKTLDEAGMYLDAFIRSRTQDPQRSRRY